MESVDILVLGASGFIGSALTKRLHQSSLKTVGMDLGIGGFDVRKPESVQRLFEIYQPKQVVYLISTPDGPHSTEHTRDCLATNVLGLAEVVEASVRAGVKRIIYIGTTKEYGSAPTPFKEDMQITPQTPYSLAKFLGEQLLLSYQTQKKINFVSLRLSTVYGPGQKDPVTLIPAAVRRCLNGETLQATKGEQKRDFIFIDDLVDLFFLILQKPEVTGIFNVGTGVETEIRSIIAKIHQLSESTSKLELGAFPYRDAEMWSMGCDIERLTAATGWKFKTSLEDGLRKTIEDAR